MVFIVSFLIVFISSWIIVIVFNPGIDNKMARITLLSFLVVISSLLGKPFGLFGTLVLAILHLVLIMKILGYDFLTAFLFLNGVALLQFLIISKLLSL